VSSVSASRALPFCCLLLHALVGSACGTQRLQTVAEATGAAGNGGALAVGGGEAVGGAPEPTRREELVGAEAFSSSYVVGPASGSRFEVTGMPFQQAWRLTMSEPPATPWSAQLLVPLSEPVAAGELLNVSFWLRCEVPGPPGDCYTEYVFERASDPWEKSVAFPAHAGGQWSQKNEYFSPVSSYAGGQAQMLFRLGYADQVVEIGGLVVQRIGQ
jgi:hypothetical protein